MYDRKTPVFIDTLEAAVETSQVFAKERLVILILSAALPSEACCFDRLCPIFRISNVTGEGLDFVRSP